MNIKKKIKSQRITLAEEIGAHMFMISKGRKIFQIYI